MHAPLGKARSVRDLYKPINIATLLSQWYVAISFFSQKKLNKNGENKKKKQENHLLRSPLSQASTLALTDQVSA